MTILIFYLSFCLYNIILLYAELLFIKILIFFHYYKFNWSIPTEAQDACVGSLDPLTRTNRIAIITLYKDVKRNRRTHSPSATVILD